MLAEYQTAGRGRRGRTWVAPPGGSICLSLCWAFREVLQDLGALGLVIGVCALRALRESGLEETGLKWPNDLVVEGKKLGGILIELRAESAGPACVVIGIGLNVALGAKLLEEIGETGSSPIDLVTAGLERLSRNALAAALISQIVHGLLVFEKEGLQPFAEEWRGADALRGHQIDVHTTGGCCAGAGARHRPARRAGRRDTSGCQAIHLRRCDREGRRMSALLVDIGNSRIKWALLKGDRLGKAQAAEYSGWRARDFARRVIGSGSDIERILVSNVAADDVGDALAAAARLAGAPKPERVTTRGARVE